MKFVPREGVDVSVFTLTDMAKEDNVALKHSESKEERIEMMIVL